VSTILIIFTLLKSRLPDRILQFFFFFSLPPGEPRSGQRAPSLHQHTNTLTQSLSHWACPVLKH